METENFELLQATLAEISGEAREWRILSEDEILAALRSIRDKVVGTLKVTSEVSNGR